MVKRGKRMTKQKRTILNILKNTTSHPTADWIYKEAKKELPDISLGTIYRNLRVLKEEGEILELQFGSTFSRFDGNPENHYHFVCENCGKVLDVDIDVKSRLENEVQNKMSVKVTEHRLEFYGICPECLNHNAE